MVEIQQILDKDQSDFPKGTFHSILNTPYILVHLDILMKAPRPI